MPSIDIPEQIIKKGFKLGLSEQQLQNWAEVAYVSGIGVETEFRSIKRYLLGMYQVRPECDKIMILQSYAFAFSAEALIAIWNIPKRLSKIKIKQSFYIIAQ